MTSTTRKPALLLLIATVAFAAVVVLVSGARATPPPITDTFSHGDDGWEIYEGTSEFDATWVPSGGNPGGYISYSDADATGSSAVFADEHYVSHIARYIGNSDIVFDLRTDAADARSPRVWITDSDDPGFPALHNNLDSAPDSSWRHYSIPLDASAARWLDAAGDRVGPARFKKVLDRDPEFVVRADYSSSAPDTTDFDSVGFEEDAQRNLTLSYKSSKKKFNGRLTYKPPTTPTMPSCISSQKVYVMRVTPGDDTRIGRATTSKSGRYSLRRRSLKKGRYYADAPEHDAAIGLVCLEAKSKTFKKR